MEIVAAVVAALAAYLIGSLSFAVLISRVMGLADPRSYGSGNPGATNVLRTGNKVAAILTLFGDAAKGWFAVWLAMRVGPRFGVGDLGIAAVAIASFLGHLYPLYFGFKGGKGVATAAGVVLALNPWLALATGITWLIIAGFFRYASLASIIAAVFAAFYSAFGWGFDYRLLALAVIAGFVVYRHRTNIANLLAGRERRIGQKVPDAVHARH